ncbi:MAG: hypothetical protein VYA60_04425 [Pseudomonadota bacterium]|nr:hypothetical protein [Pseudomonadota bacterium]
MIVRLALNEDLISTASIKKSLVDYWQAPITDGYERFNALLTVLSLTRQQYPSFEPSETLITDVRDKTTKYKEGQWVNYHLPHISVAKRASGVPSLYPISDAEYQAALAETAPIKTKSLANKSSQRGDKKPAYREMGLICSVVLPLHSKLTPRQLRWLDLLQLIPEPLDKDTEVVHLFKNEYTLLRRLDVFTSAHPVKVLPFPVAIKSPYLEYLQDNFSTEFLALPYFNVAESHVVSSSYLTCLLPNGFRQKEVDSPSYKLLSMIYGDMLKRYERCFQLTAVINAITLANPDLLDSPAKINPFDIAFSLTANVDDSEYDTKEDAIPQSKQRNDIIKSRLKKLIHGNEGIYKVYLSKLNEKVNSNGKDKPMIERFFLAGLHSGILPKNVESTKKLISALSINTCSETKYLLDYNAKKHLAFFNEVNKDDRLLVFYLRFLLKKQLFKDQSLLEKKLIESIQPLSIIEKYGHSVNGIN